MHHDFRFSQRIELAQLAFVLWLGMSVHEMRNKLKRFLENLLTIETHYIIHIFNILVNFLEIKNRSIFEN